MPFWKELEYYKEYQQDLREYLGNEIANFVLGEALYLISIGTNDFLENYYVLPQRSSQFSVEEYQNFLAGIAGNFITELYNLGARKISISGLPPMGCLPLERTTNILSGGVCKEERNAVAKDFNEKLKGLTADLNKQLPGIRLVLSNPYDILLEMIQNPEFFGKPFAMLFLLSQFGLTLHDMNDIRSNNIISGSSITKRGYLTNDLSGNLISIGDPIW
jgi:phospholipase/lecithinase/hemolysin